jgi:membrane protease YdiL (CAAX protease family)
MPDPPIDPALALFQVGMMLLSMTACVEVIQMRRRGRVLPYEPRRPVPWGAVGSILAALALITILYGTIAETPKPETDVPPAAHSAFDVLDAMLAQAVIVITFVVVVALFSRANVRDLGLPTNWRMFVRDISIGAAACLVALAPVLMLQNTLMNYFYPQLTESAHPIIKMIKESPSAWMLIWTGVATVVLAPLCEELTFRLLLQGWLERWEDRQLGWRQAAAEVPVIASETTSLDGPVAAANQSVERLAPASPAPEPPRRGIGGLPYGWFPIIVSAAAFGIAHIGYGPEPAPIFLLGLVLGYVYQRTHRIVPSMVTHALFNSFTMFILWLLLRHH